LDVAVLSNNRQLAKMLVTFGAQEGNQCAYWAYWLADSALWTHTISVIIITVKCEC
jgi:hypothetical protein